MQQDGTSGRCEEAHESPAVDEAEKVKSRTKLRRFVDRIGLDAPTLVVMLKYVCQKPTTLMVPGYEAAPW